MTNLKEQKMTEEIQKKITSSRIDRLNRLDVDARMELMMQFYRNYSEKCIEMHNRRFPSKRIGNDPKRVLNQLLQSDCRLQRND